MITKSFKIEDNMYAMLFNTQIELMKNDQKQYSFTDIVLCGLSSLFIYNSTTSLKEFFNIDLNIQNK